MRIPSTFLVLIVLTSSGSARAADKWYETQTPNFSVVSNAGEKQLRKTAIEFEQVRAAYAKVWPGARLSPSKPTLVLALKNQGTMKRWAPEYYEDSGTIDIVSVNVGGADRNYLLLRTDARPTDVEVTPNYNLYRAYLGVMLSASFPRPLPVWLQNGFTEVLGNTMVHKGEVLLGRPVPWEIKRFLDHPRYPLQEVLETQHNSPVLLDDNMRDTFDAQCYVLVHYLMFGEHGANMAKLSTFQQLWLSGRPQAEALARSFGDVDALAEALLAYAKRPILSYAQFPVDTTLEEMQPATRRLPPAEVAGLEAAVHVAMNRPADARAAITESRAADPQSPLSYDAEGLLADSQQDEAGAQAAYAKAIQLGSSNAFTYYRAAQLAWKNDADAALLARLRQHLERAVELRPSFANALSLLVQVLVKLEDGQAALSAAQRAVELEPSSSYHRLALAQALVSLDRLDEALQAARLAAGLARSQSEASNAQQLVSYVQDRIRHAARAADVEKAKKNADACSAGDSAACAALVPEMEGPCETGDANACAFLAWLYGGHGLAADPDKAATYLKKACDAGDQKSCAAMAQSP